MFLQSSKCFVALFRLYGAVRGILEATYTHSKNLASFVFLYKALTAFMRYVESKKMEYHSFIAAFVGGYLVFGKYNKVNEQVSFSSRLIF